MCWFDLDLDLDAAPSQSPSQSASQSASPLAPLTALAAELASHARLLWSRAEKPLLLRPRRAMVAVYEDEGDAYAAHRDNEWLRGA